MAPYYEDLCKDKGWAVDKALLKKMKSANEKKLKELDEAISDAEKNLGESEIRENMLAKAEYLCSIGDKVIIGFVKTVTTNSSVYSDFSNRA